MDNDTAQPTENAAESPQDSMVAQPGGNASFAAGTVEEHELPTKTAPVEDAESDAQRADPVIRAWVRQNLSWLMAEIDHGRQGKTAEERTGLNP